MNSEPPRGSSDDVALDEKWRVPIEWFLIAGTAAALLVAIILGGGTERLDWAAYDLSIAHVQFRPLNDVVVVSIDDKSLKELGRWPWPRTLHAELLRTLAKAGPRAVIYDVLFTEPADEDANLGSAIRLTPTYLPILVANSVTNRTSLPDAVLPTPAIRAAAAGLGHINMQSDKDGILRGVQLSVPSRGHVWPQLVVPVYERVLRAAAQSFAGTRLQPPSSLNIAQRILIPFNSASYLVPTISFSTVLKGEVPADFFHKKIVFIGATAPGLGDYFPIPNAGKFGEMPGVLVHVSVLTAIRNNTAIKLGDGAALFSLSLVPICAFLLALRLLAPARALALLISLVVIVAVASEGFLMYSRMWFTPVPAASVLVFTYFLWTWRRLAMAMSWILEELGELMSEPHVFPELKQRAEPGGDVLARNIRSIRYAAQRQREMRRFIWNTLNSLPNCIFVADFDSNVVFLNTAARLYTTINNKLAPSPGMQLDAIFGDMQFVRKIDATRDDEADIHWPSVLDLRIGTNATVMMNGIEVKDLEDRHHLLRYAFSADDKGSSGFWIATLLDITQMQSAQRQRDELMSFLSHDMRSPLGSILVLLARSGGEEIGAIPDETMLQQIELHARRALNLADNFVRLAHAESQSYTFQILNLAEIALDACDEVWALARDKEIKVECLFQNEDECWTFADGSLMKRALLNLLSNAIKYSRPNGNVECRVRVSSSKPGDIECVVQDQGYGIEPQQLPHLFERFRRFRAPGQPPTDGVGLGLAFVKTVVVRHRGTISVQSTVGIGTVITITLPVSTI